MFSSGFYLFAFLVLAPVAVHSHDDCDDSSESHEYNGGGGGGGHGGGGGGGGHGGNGGGGGGGGWGGRRCEDGWHLFQRRQGNWCVKVFDTYWPPVSQAEQTCTDNNAKLSGIQNRAEFDYLSNILQERKKTNPSVGMWLGGRRSAICAQQDCTKLPATAFYWTDGHTTGTEGFIWQPNVNPSGNGDCLRLLIDPWGRQVDDIPCEGRFQAVMFVCGKKAV